MERGFPEAFVSLVEAIRRDNTSGATTLVGRAAEALRLWALHAEPHTPAAFRAQAARAGRALIRAQPAMAPMVRLVNDVLWELEAACDVAEARARVGEICQRFVADLETAGARIAHHASGLIPNGGTVLTHSYSQTVLDTLLAARREGKDVQVICTESRPVGEGAALARQLGGAGVPATLVIDAALAAVAPEAALALAGADAVTPAGLVNKTGTCILALAARHFNRPFYALTSSAKFVPDGCRLGPEPPRPPQEILPEPLPGVTVRNFYFETTPLELLTDIVTEDGLLAPSQALRSLRRRRAHPALVAPQPPPA